LLQGHHSTRQSVANFGKLFVFTNSLYGVLFSIVTVQALAA